MNRITIINQIKDISFKYIGILSSFIGLSLVLLFFVYVFIDGYDRLSWDFLMALPSRFAEKAGTLTAWTGTIWILGLTAITSIPLGITAGIYLEEYSEKNIFTNLLEVNISNLAGIPSIIYGILGLEIFVRTLHLGGSLLAGSFTLSLLILPIIIVTTREAIKSVPSTIKEASYALGATRWQTIQHQILPACGSNIMTGIILALARAIGETAPLIAIGALAYVPYVAQTPLDEFTVLPMQIYNWVSRPQHAFIVNAAAAIIILLIIVVLMNITAIYIRNKSKKKMQW